MHSFPRAENADVRPSALIVSCVRDASGVNALAAMSFLLELRHGLRIAGIASDGLDAMHHVRVLRPRLVLVGDIISGMGIGEFARCVRRLFPQTRVLRLSGADLPGRLGMASSAAAAALRPGTDSAARPLLLK